MEALSHFGFEFTLILIASLGSLYGVSHLLISGEHGLLANWEAQLKRARASIEAASVDLSDDAAIARIKGGLSGADADRLRELLKLIIFHRNASRRIAFANRPRQALPLVFTYALVTAAIDVMPMIFGGKHVMADFPLYGPFVFSLPTLALGAVLLYCQLHEWGRLRTKVAEWEGEAGSRTFGAVKFGGA